MARKRAGGVFRQAAGGEDVGEAGEAGFRVRAGAGHDDDGHEFRDCLPAFPSVEVAQIVGAHDPDEAGLRRHAFEAAYQVYRVACPELGFEAGDERVPYASLFAAESIDSLTLTASAKVVVKAPEIYLADEEGAQPLSRVGDLVEVALPPETPFVGTVGGSPATGVITFVDTAQGYITSGSERARSK